MIFNQPGDFSEILYYEGDYYSNGTEVMLTDEYISTHTFNGKKLWKYAYFNNKVLYGNKTIAYFFFASRTTWLDYQMMGIDYANRDEYAPYFVLYSFQLPNAIQEFTKPFTRTDQQQEMYNKAVMNIIEHPRRDWDCPELIIGWLIYIGAMLGSLIFNEFYILWAIATYIFYRYRNGVINQ